MKYAILLAAMVFLAGSSHAQEWTRDDAVAHIRDLVLTQRPMDEWPERDRAIAAWLERVSEDAIDLGEYAFLRGVAMYFKKDYAGGAAKLFEYMQTHASLPDQDFNMIAGRLLMTHAINAVRNGDLQSGRAAIPHALALYHEPRTVYRTIAKTLQQSREPEAPAALNELLAHMLTDERMNDDAKQTLLRELYGPPPDMPAGRRDSPARPTTLKSFVAKDIDGGEVSLANLRGKVVLVDFWATWCGPCMREMPNVVEAYEQYRNDGFTVVGISLDKEPGQTRGGPILTPDADSVTLAKVREICKDNGMVWTIVYEGGGWETRLAVENNIRSIPATFLIDREGAVRFTNLRGRALLDRVSELIAED